MIELFLQSLRKGSVKTNIYTPIKRFKTKNKPENILTNV